MIDRKLVREQPELIREAMRRRGSDYDVDELLGLDERRRELLQVEELKAERNQLSRQIGEMVRAGTDADELKARVSGLKERIGQMEEELAGVEQLFDKRMLELPNIPLAIVPDGAGEEDNVVLKEWGKPVSPDFTPRGHWELGESLGILDFEKGARLAGARFVTDLGMGAAMERALINLMLDTHTRRNGYTEVMPPLLANERSLVGTATLPKFDEDLFKTREGYYLVPTAEVPLTNMHQGEILDAADLPRYYTAYTPCFRSEAGAAGRESRGLIRLHQFNKVELMKFTTAEQATEEHEKLTRDAEGILETLGLCYRRVALCTGDMGFQPVQTYDLEVWMPGMDRWVEISSCSQYGEFQARRCETRYRADAEARPAYVHTMNGSALAVGRTLAAILENYQTANGAVVVPEALRGYLGGVAELLPPMP